MRNIISLFILFLCLGSYNITTAQYKEYNKLDELFNTAKFDKCIEQALKYNIKESGELMPVLFCSKSYFELFTTSHIGRSSPDFTLKTAVVFYHGCSITSPSPSSWSAGMG